MITIEYNGVKCENKGCFLYDYPNFGGGEKVYNTYAIPGMDGELVEATEYLSNLTITCIFSIISDRVMDTIRFIRQWLSGSGTLVVSDSPDIFYRVLKIEYSGIEREIRKYGRFTAKFVCVPFEYLKAGQQEIEPNGADNIFNPGDVSKPVYVIEGTGSCVLTVNNYDFTVNVTESVTIDSELQMTYDSEKNVKNTAATGDYRGLWLKRGENKVVLSSGFTVKILPKWGYKV